MKKPLYSKNSQPHISNPNRDRQGAETLIVRQLPPVTKSSAPLRSRFRLELSQKCINQLTCYTTHQHPAQLTQTPAQK